MAYPPTDSSNWVEFVVLNILSMGVFLSDVILGSSLTVDLSLKYLVAISLIVLNIIKIVKTLKDKARDKPKNLKDE